MNTQVAKPLPSVLPPFPVRRFSVDEYHQLIQIGVLDTGERCELINGWIKPKWPAHPTHASVIRRLDRLLQKKIKGEAVISVCQPITTGDSEPIPDLAVCRGKEDFYFAGHPRPEDIHFVVEVVEENPGPDHEERVATYARAMIPQCWIVKLAEGSLEVLTAPRTGRRPAYMQRQAYGRYDRLLVNVGGKSFGRILVKELLP